MTFIKQVTLSSHDARELEHLGFVLHLKAMHLNGLDTYDVFVK